MLHVTNGDSLAARVEAAQAAGAVPPGDVLPWRDALHDGPVPPISDHELRRVRAAFLAESFGADAAEIESWLAARDARLDAALAGGEEIVLWFDGDLYDRLQLAQIGARAAAAPGRARLRRVQLDEREHEDVAALWAAQQGQPGCVTAGLAVEWAALRAGRFEALPARLREELPWTTDGLALSERNILRAIEDDAATPEEIFVAQAAHEERPFLGDAWVMERLERLAPLLEVAAGPRCALAVSGWRVLAGDDDAVAVCGLDRWLGGVHLTAEEHLRWDPASATVVRYPSPR